MTSARDIITTAQAREGWTGATVLAVLQDYLDETGQAPQLAAYVATRYNGESDEGQDWEETRGGQCRYCRTDIEQSTPGGLWRDARGPDDAAAQRCPAAPGHKHVPQDRPGPVRAVQPPAPDSPPGQEPSR